MLYLYLASNANNYEFALSPAAIRQAIGMPASTYRDQFVKLVDKGYLVQRKESAIYDFYETPQRVTHTEPIETIDGLDFTADAYGTPQTVNNEAGKDIEININKTDTINISGRGETSFSYADTIQFLKGRTHYDRKRNVRNFTTCLG